MGKNIKKIHILLNKIYKIANKDYHNLLDCDIKCNLIYCRNNYIYYEGEYHLQKYPIPVIDIKGSGDIGYNLDNIFFEFSLNKTNFLNLNFEYILNSFEEVEVYGGENCLIDFYDKGDSVEEIKTKVRISKKKKVMFSIYHDYDKENLIDLFLDLNKRI